jgi:hypothetical protein
MELIDLAEGNQPIDRIPVDIEGLAPPQSTIDRIT